MIGNGVVFFAAVQDVRTKRHLATRVQITSHTHRQFCQRIVDVRGVEQSSFGVGVETKCPHSISEHLIYPRRNLVLGHPSHDLCRLDQRIVGSVGHGTVAG